MLTIEVENALPFKIPAADSGYHGFRRRHDHPNLSFNYSTMGVPIPGNTFNFTRVEDKDLATFDEEVNRLLKPYNVRR